MAFEIQLPWEGKTLSIRSYPEVAPAHFVGSLEVAIDQGIERGAAFSVIGTDARSGAVHLKSALGEIIPWHPDRWGSTDVYKSTDREFRAGDRAEFTRNDSAMNRTNGRRADVVKVDPIARTIILRTSKGRTLILSADEVRDQHFRHAYVQTAFAAQGKTADRATVHFDSKQVNLTDLSVLYVAISGVRENVVLVTNSRANIAHGLEERSGIAQKAMPTHDSKQHLGQTISR